MSTIKVRLKDASGNVLHPETDWSVVQNKPSIEAPDDVPEERWNVPDKSIDINGKKCGISLDATRGIIIYDEHQIVNNAVPLTEYPIKWDSINGRPFRSVVDLTVGSSSRKVPIAGAVFGVYSVITSSAINYYPAFATVNSIIGSKAAQYGMVYLSNGVFQSVASQDYSKFIPLTDL